MKTEQRNNLMVASSIALLLALGACDRVAHDTTAQRADSAGAKAGAAMDSAADKARSMGASAVDKVDDAVITTKVKAAIAADKDLSAIKIDVDTQNGVVTLSGPAPTASAKEHASEVARTIKGVTSVNNQLTLKTG
jgi:hyperosmotically inducible protein